MSEYLYLTTIGLPLATILAIFAMRSLSAVAQARARFAHDDAYRRLAEQAVAAQSENALTLVRIQTVLTDLGTRVASVEQILKQVE